MSRYIVMKLYNLFLHVLTECKNDLCNHLILACKLRGWAAQKWGRLGVCLLEIYPPHHHHQRCRGVTVHAHKFLLWFLVKSWQFADFDQFVLFILFYVFPCVLSSISVFYIQLNMVGIILFGVGIFVCNRCHSRVLFRV